MKFILLCLLAAIAVGETPAPQLRVSMISLGVKDPTRSIRFYQETLGLQMVGPPGEVTSFRAGDLLIVLNQPLGLSAGAQMNGAVEIVFPVGKVSSTHAQLMSRGCRFISGPHEIFSGTWAATFTDPDGHKLTILGPQ